jgi:shikimate kinase
MNIYLIGYRCSGKTSVGTALAGMLDRCLVDTDRVIVNSRGMSIAEIVRWCGWEKFRELEAECLRSIASGESQVVATGGGIVLSEANVDRMRRTGKVVWLRIRPDTVAVRMAADPVTGAQRPALTDLGAMEEIASILAIRNPLYEAAMDAVVDVDDMSVEGICRVVMDLGGFGPL